MEKSQRDLGGVKKNLSCENERVKDYQQKFQAESRARDDMPNKNLKNAKQLMRKEYESLREKLREERSKSGNLRKEVHRLRLTLKGMPGRTWLLKLLPHYRPRLLQNLDFLWIFSTCPKYTTTFHRKRLFVKISNWNSDRHLLT